ncbi:MAG: Fur family transcriptional regulator [Lachnospiraceae bacterium]
MKRNTFQRDLIFDTIQKLKSHPTVETVYEEIIKQYPNISKATVYRNLNKLAEKGYIGRISIPNGADCFDHIPDNHYHTKCSICNKVFDVDMDYITNLETYIKDTHGFKFETHNIVFGGICKKCQS